MTNAPSVVRAPSVWVLIAISTLSPLSMNIYLPSLSGMMEYFSASASQVQMTISLAFAAVGFAQLILGPLSDRYGRRPVILWGLAVYVLGSGLCLIAPTIETLIAARILQSVGGGAGLVLGRAIVRDLYDRDKAASMIGYVTMGLALGPTLAPFLGGFLDHSFGWRGGFWLMLVSGIVVLLVSFSTLHETNRHMNKEIGIAGLLRNYGTLCRESLFWAYTLTATFTAFVYFAYLGGVPYIAGDTLQMRPDEMGFYFMFVGLGYIIGNGISGRIAVRVGVLRMLILGTLITTLGVSVLIFENTFLNPLSGAMLFLPMTILGLGNGMCLPSAMSGIVSVRPDLAGAASGLGSTFQVGMGAVSSSLVAWLLSDGMFRFTVWPMLAVMALGVALTWLFIGFVAVGEKNQSRS